MKPLVSIIMGSTSDLPVMEKACKWLNDNQIPFEVNALSAHRTPDAVESFAKGAKEREEAYGKVVDMVLNLRAKAKADKDWATSDQIRDALAEAGFEVKDTKDGVTWKLNK